MLGTPDYANTLEELEQRWTEISRQYIFMYPGGAGARIEQFLMIPDFMNVKSRKESQILPLWFPNKLQGFLPDEQGGFVGPVTSYFKRLDSNHRQFW